MVNVLSNKFSWANVMARYIHTYILTYIYDIEAVNYLSVTMTYQSEGRGLPRE